MEFYYQFFVGTLYTMLESARFIDASIYRDTCHAIRIAIHLAIISILKKKKKFNAARLGHALPKIMCLLAVRRGIDAKARSR